MAYSHISDLGIFINKMNILIHRVMWIMIRGILPRSLGQTSTSADLLLYGGVSKLVQKESIQHVELDESPGEDAQRADDAHRHEDAQQDVVQHHGNKLPLLRCLGTDGGPGQRRGNHRRVQGGGVSCAYV